MVDVRIKDIGREIPQEKIPLERVSRRLLSHIRDWPLGNPRFIEDPRYDPKPLSPSNFHSFELVDYDGNICFVDGGNFPLINTPSLFVQLCRICFCIFNGEERIQSTSLPRVIDFFAVSYAAFEGDHINYHTELMPRDEDLAWLLPDEKDLVFSSLDPSMKVGYQRAPLSTASTTSRVFAEWRLASAIIEKELEEGDVIVRDGSLQTRVTRESKYADETYEIAIRNGVFFTGLSKTSTLFTDTGFPLFAAIDKLSRKNGLEGKSWFYHPIVDVNTPDHRAEMYGVKLHPRSEYVFRFEMLKDQALKIGEERSFIFSSLAENASDITFPGYPYGLVAVDRMARVSEDEAEIFAIQLKSAISKMGNWGDLRPLIRSTDAHERLNKI